MIEITTLTDENYHGVESRMKYMGSSQFKDFLKCEKEALKRCKGELEDKSTDALLFGGYVDAYFSNELDSFVKKHPEMFNAKNGELKAPFKSIDKVIETIKNDELLLKYLSGEHQKIMVGEIVGVPFKIKIDSLLPKVIVDQKIMRDLNYVWIEQDGKNVKTDFIKAYGYDIQGAIYQEIERQNHLKETGEDRKLPFVLAVTTKEEYPDKALIKIDQEYLDEALDLVKRLAPRFDSIKKGLVEPIGCGKCGVCRSEKRLEGIQSYKKLFHNVEDDIEY